jgi:hypothetical protein
VKEVILKNVWLCAFLILGYSTSSEDLGVHQRVFKADANKKESVTSNHMAQESFLNAIYRVKEEEKVTDDGSNVLLGLYVFFDVDDQQSYYHPSPKNENQSSAIDGFDEPKLRISGSGMYGRFHLLLISGWGMSENMRGWPKISESRQSMITGNNSMKPDREVHTAPLASKAMPYVRHNTTGLNSLLATGRTVQL